MNYRKFGSKDISVSPLGFGMMRLPLINKENDSKVDEKSSIEMLRYAIDKGLNYVDTAYNYLDGQSEIITGKALLDGYREKVFLATKAPIWLYENEEDFDEILDEQLSKLQSKSIDLYLLHGLNKNLWKDKVLKFNILDKMKKAKDEGKINNIGFSFHDDIKIFKEIIDYSPHWDFCQIQLNYLDIEFQAGIEGLKYASSKGLGVIIMEPLRGGYLVNLPKKVQNTFDSYNCEKTPLELAFDFLWDMPEVSVVLSGMTNINEVKENIGYANNSFINMLNNMEKDIIYNIREEFKTNKVIPCTFCNYCSNCPNNIAIPYNIAALNEYYSKGDLDSAKILYEGWVIMFGNQSKECIGCKKCEEICPQKIKISEIMSKISEILG